MQIRSLDSRISRRSFFSTIAAAGSAFALGCTFEMASAQTGRPTVPLNAWVRIEPDNTVTLVVSQAEIGQGISTTLPAVIAEEMGADWGRVRLENSPADPAYRNPRINWQFTGYSESTTAFFDLMREMGAGAREMLIAAASDCVKAPVSEFRTEQSQVVHTASARTFLFSELAADAA